jgi:hypothetical protein
MSAARGSCFGYDIHSELSFRFLRHPGGDRLEVYEHSADLPTPDAVLWEEWPPDEVQTVHVWVYRAPDTYQLRVGDDWFLIDPAALRIGVPTTDDPVGREERTWGLPLMLCFHHRGDLPLHAAAVEVDGGALVIGAPSQFGKTTLAAAFWQAGHRVLSEDLVCVEAGVAPSVIPGPAMLRLRADMADRLEVTSAPEAIRGRGRVRMPLEDGLSGSEAVPLRGIVLLVDEAETISLDRIPPVEAIPLLWELVFTMPEPFDSARCFRDVAELAATVPIWGLRRPLTVESLPEVVAFVAANA